MRKTSIYLTDDEAEGLRRLALITGESQAELVHDGVRRLIESENGTGRAFHSLGKGCGDGSPYAPWNADDLYADTMGH